MIFAVNFKTGHDNTTMAFDTIIMNDDENGGGNAKTLPFRRCCCCRCSHSIDEYRNSSCKNQDPVTRNQNTRIPRTCNKSIK